MSAGVVSAELFLPSFWHILTRGSALWSFHHLVYALFPKKVISNAYYLIKHLQTFSLGICGKRPFFSLSFSVFSPSPVVHCCFLWCIIFPNCQYAAMSLQMSEMSHPRSLCASSCGVRARVTIHTETFSLKTCSTALLVARNSTGPLECWCCVLCKKP